MDNLVMGNFMIGKEEQKPVEWDWQKEFKLD